MSIELMMLFNHLILCFPFSSCSQSFPASGSFPMSWLFTSGGQSIGTSVSASVLPMNIQGWFPLRLTSLISLQFKGLSSFLQHHNLKASILQRSAQLSYSYMTTGKTIAQTIWTFVGKRMSLLFNTLSRFVIAFLPRSKCLLISWLQMLENLPAIQEIWVQSLGWEDPLGEGNGNPLQYSCLENPMDRGACRATKSRT